MMLSPKEDLLVKALSFDMDTSFYAIWQALYGSEKPFPGDLHAQRRYYGNLISRTNRKIKTEHKEIRPGVARRSYRLYRL